jgi:hypothetical protein
MEAAQKHRAKSSSAREVRVIKSHQNRCGVFGSQRNSFNEGNALSSKESYMQGFVDKLSIVVSSMKKVNNCHSISKPWGILRIKPWYYASARIVLAYHPYE